MRRIALLAATSVFLWMPVVTVSAHEGEGTVEPVTSGTMNEAAGGPEADDVVIDDDVIDANLKAIQEEVSNATAMIDVKAGALAVAVAGLAFTSLRRRNGKEASK